MDVRYVNPFIRSIKRVFETMVKVTVTVGKPVVRNDASASADVSGIIGFSGDAVGAVVLCFPRKAACAAASKFAGIEINEDHPDFADAIGELANMVAGAAKTDMEGLNLSISLPSVIIGENHFVSQSRTSPRIVIPCQCELGPIYVEIGMEMKKTADATSMATAGANQ